MSIEEEKQTRFSPGPVLSEETLLRIIYYPAHIDDNGELKPEAIPTQDLRDRGFSVYRKLYVTRAKITSVIDNYVSRKSERECRGISPVLSRTVRNISDKEGNQSFHVLDDAKTEDDEAHAQIKYARSYGRAVQKGLRDKLRREFTTILEVESVCGELRNNKLFTIKKIVVKIKEFFLYYWMKFIAKQKT